MPFNLGAVTRPGRLPIVGLVALLFSLFQAQLGTAQQMPAPEVYPQIVGGFSALASAIRFPDAARSDGREGLVTLDVFVTARGDIETVRIRESADHDFDAAALAAVRGLRFIPAYEDGQPVPSHLVIPVRFSQPRTPITRTPSHYRSGPRVTSPPPRTAYPAEARRVAPYVAPETRRTYVPPTRTRTEPYAPRPDAQPSDTAPAPRHDEYVPPRRTPSGRFAPPPPVRSEHVPPRHTPTGRFIPSPSPTGPGYTTPAEAEVALPAYEHQGRVDEPDVTILRITETPTPGTTRAVERVIIHPPPDADGRPLTWGARTDGQRLRAIPSDGAQELVRVERAQDVVPHTAVPTESQPAPEAPPAPDLQPAPSPFVHSAPPATRVEDTRISLPGFDFRRLQNPEIVRNLLDGALYPEAARSARINGEVLVMFVADESGSVAEAVIARGLGGGVDERALDIVRSMRFHPPVIQGQPTELRSQILVRFES
jgi:TonB family protein